MPRSLTAGLAALITGLFIIYLGIMGSMQDKAVKERGIDTVASIVDKKTEVTEDNDGDEHETYWLHFKFSDTNKTEHQTKRSTSWAIYNSTAIGAQVPIKYLSENPDTVRFKHETEGNPMALAYALGLIGGVLSITGVVMLAPGKGSGRPR